MIFHPEEYEAAKRYWNGKDFPELTSEQIASIKAKGDDLIKFHLRHPVIHSLINLTVIVLIFTLDYWILLYSGAPFKNNPLLSGLIIGILHGIIMYSLAIFTLHEGAAHKIIVLLRNKLSRFLATIVNNLNRLTLSESDYYAKSHLSHHANFASAKDDEFLNFVSAKRFYSSFIPFASVFNLSDFKAHTGMKYTASRITSLFLTILYNGIFALLMLKHYSPLTIVIALVIVFPNIAFWLDRIRQYTEHNLMPLNAVNGARDLGTDFWGMLIGGGPWGQPCHWTHHLYPGIPWYNQLILHKFVKRSLTDKQKQYFLLKPIIGYPAKLLFIIKATSKLE